MRFKPIPVEEPVEGETAEVMRIQYPHFRLVSDTMFGATAKELLGDEIAPETYWTPRWEAILFMIGSLYTKVATNSIFKNARVKIYRTDDALMRSPPKEHAWAFNYATDAGEMVLVRLLEPAAVIFDDLVSSTETISLAIDSLAYEQPIDHSRHGMSATLKDKKQVWITPNYRQRSLDIAQRKIGNGWQYQIINQIRSYSEWQQFRQSITNVDWDGDASIGIDWFFYDVNWLQHPSEN